jgi:hypothetical protein
MDALHTPSGVFTTPRKVLKPTTFRGWFNCNHGRWRWPSKVNESCKMIKKLKAFYHAQTCLTAVRAMARIGMRVIWRS